VKAFITGGAGFIGSRLSASLTSKGFDVVGYDNFHIQVHGENPNINLSHNVVRGDVRDLDALSDAIGEFDPDIIFHLAAETGTGQSFDEPSRYVDVNVRGTTNLFEACRIAKVKPKRIILASSRAVYGEGLYINQSGEVVEAYSRSSALMTKGDFAVYGQLGDKLIPRPTPETLQPKPDSVYASSKLMQELLVKNLATNSDWSILRFQNVYGPGQSLTNPYTGVLSIFCSQIKSSKALEIYEDGEIYRDFVYVDDVVSSLVYAIKAPPGHIFNIGSGSSVSILEVAKALLDIAKSVGYSSAYKVTGNFRDGDIRYAQADIDKAKLLLGWSPTTCLSEGLKRLANWSFQLNEN
jgi:dTDP-L-rhamnose 4-epimerase